MKRATVRRAVPPEHFNIEHWCERDPELKGSGVVRIFPKSITAGMALEEWFDLKCIEAKLYFDANVRDGFLLMMEFFASEEETAEFEERFGAWFVLP